LRQRHFAPKEEGAIPLDVNTLGQPAGPHRWYVQVDYRQGQELRQVTLQMLAEVVTEVTVQPASLTIHASRPITQELRLTDLRTRPLKVQTLRTSSPHLQATAGKSFQDEQGNAVVPIQLRSTDGFPEGRHEEYVAIDTDDAVYAELRIPVTIIRPTTNRLSATPMAIVLHTRTGKGTSARLFLIRDVRDEQVVIADVRADHPAVSCKWAAGPGSAATVRVQLDPSALPRGEFSTVVRVHVSQPVAEVVTVPVRCSRE
jgi:hypothetical protein